MDHRRLALLPSVFGLLACTGGPSSAFEQPFRGEREEALRAEECPARLSIDVTAVEIPNDDRLLDDLSRDLRAKGAADPATEARAQVDDLRPWLGDARTAAVSLVATSTVEACSYAAVFVRTNAPAEHQLRIVRTRRENGGESALVLRIHAPLGTTRDARLWLDVPLESSNARSLVVDTGRTPALFAQVDERMVPLGTFTANARVVE